MKEVRFKWLSRMDLEHLTIQNCQLNEFDGKEFTGLKSIDLRENRICSVPKLQNCTLLDSVDLGCNEIENVELVYLNIGNIQVLRLNSNRLRNTNGIAKLISLQVNMVDGLE